MILGHFGLDEQPFGVTPDPRFLYLGRQHREALASLVYGTEANRGFLALIAPPGMGKTSLLFQYMEGLRSKARTAFLFQTDCDSRELLRHILRDLGLDASGKDLPSMHEMLNGVLEEEMRLGRRFVLVIDEAQNLDEKGLEAIRLLSNFETPWAKLMHIVIAGQPQLAEKLGRTSMAQLRQRIASFIGLRSFSAEETNAYIDHRLRIAGYSGPSLLTRGARRMVAKYSRGIPRNINHLCFGAMSLAYAAGKKQIDAKMAREAARDLEIERMAQTAGNFAVAPIAGTGGVRGDGGVRRGWRWIPAISTACALLALVASVATPWRASGQGRNELEQMRVGVRGVEPATTAEAVGPAEESAAPTAPAALDADTKPASEPAIPSSVVRATHSDGARGPRVTTVIVPRGATLRQLSLQYAGKFDVSTLLEICALNPEIADPTHIEAGQRLRLPVYLDVADPKTKVTAARIATPNTHEE